MLNLFIFRLFTDNNYSVYCGYNILENERKAINFKNGYF